MRSGYEPQAWIYLDRSRGDATCTRIVNRMWENSYTHACLPPMRKRTSTRAPRPGRQQYTIPDRKMTVPPYPIM
jgi:hypothetical protein